MLDVLLEVMPEHRFFRASYSKDDCMYTIEPSVDKNCELFENFISSDSALRAVVLDEHGKLKFTYVQEKTSSEFFSTVYDYKIYDQLASKTKMLECSDRSTPFYLIEDYKLKKLIDRLISTLEFYGAKSVKYERGSLHNDHLMWMLKEIYTQRKPITKRYNWLGFVQCALVSKNIIDIKHERDIMNQIF